jgi:enoyl-CoA hydratase
MPIVHYEARENVALLRLDDGKANAFGYALLDELDAALDRAEREAAAVVIAGRAGRFSAGFDLGEMMAGIDKVRALVGRGAKTMLRLYGLGMPLVAACTGHALAAGAFTLLTCDVRVAAKGAFKIGLNEATIGMPLPIVAVELCRDRLKPEHLLRSTLFGQTVDPEGAVAAGWVDELADEAAVVDTAVARAALLAKLPRPAYAQTKLALRERTIAYVNDTLAMDLARLTAPSK